MPPNCGFFKTEYERPSLPLGKETILVGNQACRAKCDHHCPPDEEGEVCDSHCPMSKWDFIPGVAHVRYSNHQGNLFPLLRPKHKRLDQEAAIGSNCRTCAETEPFVDPQPCNHDESERSFEGSFTLAELHYAVYVQGTKIHEIHEIVFFSKFTKNIFDKFMSKLAVLKVASSPLPKHLEGPDVRQEDLEKYAEEISVKSGLPISADMLKPNSGLKSVAKLEMNGLVS